MSCGFGLATLYWKQHMEKNHTPFDGIVVELKAALSDLESRHAHQEKEKSKAGKDGTGKG